MLLRSLGLVFHGKKKYITRYTVFTLNVLFYTLQGRQEWVDGGGWVWMMRAINSTPHQSSWFALAVWAFGCGFLFKDVCYFI